MSQVLVQVVPAEVEQRAGSGGDALCRPAEEVELSEGPGLLRLDVLQGADWAQSFIRRSLFLRWSYLRNKDRLMKEWEDTAEDTAEPSAVSIAQSDANSKKNR
ncbi:hypothetical protein KUCAC02_000948 [Chaenocephalus aceratus]|uniref:Uncharacterized protein n=1 Tax=Chaenocephalus aceratus TaxID=36190 RepID=A0ACB9XUW7_CHAAC|nr:hypothetical protein KUCAC02_000948 [Chaenocephalus aceratus]